MLVLKCVSCATNKLIILDFLEEASFFFFFFLPFSFSTTTIKILYCYAVTSPHMVFEECLKYKAVNYCNYSIWVCSKANELALHKQVTYLVNIWMKKMKKFMSEVKQQHRQLNQ